MYIVWYHFVFWIIMTGCTFWSFEFQNHKFPLRNCGLVNFKFDSLRSCALPSAHRTQLQDIRSNENSETSTLFKDQVYCAFYVQPPKNELCRQKHLVFSLQMHMTQSKHLGKLKESCRPLFHFTEQ